VFNQSLNYLDVAFNSITDRAVLILIDEASKNPDLGLRFVKLGGNAFTNEPAIKLYEWFESNEKLVQVTIGASNENPNLSPDLCQKFADLSRTRMNAYYLELKEKEEEQVRDIVCFFLKF
jgi:hypothetical protein